MPRRANTFKDVSQVSIQPPEDGDETESPIAEPAEKVADPIAGDKSARMAAVIRKSGESAEYLEQVLPAVKAFAAGDRSLGLEDIFVEIAPFCNRLHFNALVKAARGF